MPPKKKQETAAGAAADDKSEDVPAITRMPTTMATGALIRGPSFAQSIRDDRKQRIAEDKQAPAPKPKSPRRSSHGTTTTTVSARSSAAAAKQTVAASAAAATGDHRLSSVVARGFTTSQLPPLQREPTMLHQNDGHLVPSISPVRGEFSGLEFPSGTFLDSATAGGKKNKKNSASAAAAAATKKAGEDAAAAAAEASAAKQAAEAEQQQQHNQQDDDDDEDDDDAQQQHAAKLPRYSIVLDLDETLVYGREGELVARAHLKQFMRSLDSARVEVVVWTAAERSYAKQVVKEINENNVIRHCIYRDDNWFDPKDYTKNLEKLGRPMDHVLIVENTPDCIRENPQNGIIVSDFEGETKHKDSTLLKLSLLIENLVASGLPVPKFLASCPMLRRQSVEVDNNKHLPIFFLSSRALRTKKDAAAAGGAASPKASGGSSSAATSSSVVGKAVQLQDDATNAGGADDGMSTTTNNDDDEDDASAASAAFEEVKVVKANRDKAPGHQLPPGAASAAATTTSTPSGKPPTATAISVAGGGTTPKSVATANSNSQHQQPTTPHQPPKTGGTGAKTPASRNNNAAKLLTPRNRAILKSPSARGVAGNSGSAAGFDVPTGIVATARSPAPKTAGSPRARSNHAAAATTTTTTTTTAMSATTTTTKNGPVRRQREDVVAATTTTTTTSASATTNPQT